MIVTPIKGSFSEAMKQLNKKSRKRKPKKITAWAVVMNPVPFLGIEPEIGWVFTDSHPEDIYSGHFALAIYPKKKDAIEDKKFRGGSKVLKVTIQPVK